MMGDIRNACLTAPDMDKAWTTCRPEFGPDSVSKQAIIVRALHGLKNAGASFRNHLAKRMRDLHWEPCDADPNVWMRAAIRSDGFACWLCALIHVDDLLVIAENPKEILAKIDCHFPIKPKSIAGPPNVCLKAKLSKHTLKNGVDAWAMSSSQCVQEAVKNVESHLAESGLSLPGKANTPLTSDCRPELDVSPQLDPELANHFTSLIGVLQWCCDDR
jgi:hypothetical protein